MSNTPLYLGTLSLQDKLDLTQGSSLRIHLGKDLMDPKNEIFRKWYFSKFISQQRQFYKTEYFLEIERKDEIIYFVPWFLQYYLQQIRNQINVLEKDLKIKEGKILKAIQPLSEPLILNQDLDVTAFIKALKEALPEIVLLFKQLNYSNAFMNTLRSQLTQIKQSLNKVQEKIFFFFLKEKKKSYTYQPQDLKDPIIKPPLEVVEGFKKPELTVDSIIDSIQKKLGSLSLGVLVDFKQEQELSQEVLEVLEE